jgi:hypothetical protein
MIGLAFEAIRLGRDEVNIRTLARHLGCSVADARRLYHLSRRDGYGAAYEAVFGHARAPAAVLTSDPPEGEAEVVSPESATPEPAPSAPPA